MCVDETQIAQKLAGDTAMRVDIVDSWHKQWPVVLETIDRSGGRQKLLVDRDGWLSARQCLLVAFRDVEIAGHLVFRIQPSLRMVVMGRPTMEAHLDDCGVRPGFSDAQVRQLLLDAATRRAKALRCRTLVNF